MATIKLNPPHEKSKMTSNKSDQVDDDGNQNNNDNQKTISETKDEQSMTLDTRVDKCNTVKPVYSGHLRFLKKCPL